MKTLVVSVNLSQGLTVVVTFIFENKHQNNLFDKVTDAIINETSDNMIQTERKVGCFLMRELLYLF